MPLLEKTFMHFQQRQRIFLYF